MRKIYVLFIKNIVDDTSLPTFEIRYTPIEGKVAVIEPGECVDAFKCSFGGQGSHIVVNQFCVQNIDGEVEIVPTESYILQRSR